MLVAFVTACSGGGGASSAETGRPGSGAAAPVVTSVVGAAPPSGPATTSAPPSTAGPTTTTTTDFGESQNPIAAAPAPAPVAGPAAGAAEAVALAFLQRFWSPAARTSGQLADDIAPYATDNLLAVYRDPTRVDLAVPGAGVGNIAVRTTDATPATAVVVGEGTMVDEPDRRMVFRTLSLVLAPDGAWKVESIR